MRSTSRGKTQGITYYIFTEGETEKNYFLTLLSKHRVSSKVICAKDHEPNNIPTYCENYLMRDTSRDEGDPISIVLDVDDRSSADLLELENKCRKRGINMYLSNRSFECWILMHFRSIDKPLTQEEMKSELSKFLKQKYSKTGNYQKIYANVEKAMVRANNVIDSSDNCNKRCLMKNPSTTVHLLVKCILEEKKN